MIGNKYDTFNSNLKNNFNTTNTDDEEEKNFKKIGSYLSSTYQNFSSEKKRTPELSYFSNFPGFFNRKFNLTSFKKEREDSRSRSRSPERIIEPHQIKGNGIPKDIVSRIKFLGKIFNSSKFRKFIKLNITKKNNFKFDEISEKIINFSKRTSQLEGIMMVYYFITNYINYDYTFLEHKNDYKKSQSIETVFKYKKALSLGYTNLFETFMKKLGVKCKHIEGYCKLLPDRNVYLSYNNNNNSSIIKNNNSIYNNASIYNSKENFINRNNSIMFTMYNDSSIINNKIVGPSRTLSKINYFEDIELENDLSNYINHCWNAFYFKGEWYLVDTVLGSSSLDKEKLKNISINKNNEQSNNIIVNINSYNNNNNEEKETNFNPFYFMTPPEILINSHLPGKDSWQMTQKFCTLKQFNSKRLINFDKFYKGLYKYDIELLTHQNPFIQVNIRNNLVIKLKIFSYLIEAHLYESTGMHKVSDTKYSFDVKNGIFIFEPIFPKSGEYLLKLNIRPVNSTDLIYKPLFDYLIRVTNNMSFNHFEKYKKLQQAKSEKLEDSLLLPKIHGYSHNGNSISLNKPLFHSSQARIITDYNKIFPSRTNKVICYDNEGFVLIEPRSVFIRKGMTTKFKFRIKGAHSVFLLDGNKITPFKKVEENTFEGKKEIKSDNVSICCLKNKNVFTEVFRFKTKKTMLMSNSFGIGFRKQRKNKIKKISEINDSINTNSNNYINKNNSNEDM